MDDAEHKQQTLQLVERMEAMIASLLRLEKLNADGYAFEFNICDLRELAQDARAQFTALYPKKHIEIIGGADIRCDAYWMSEALSNLIKNACEHTTEDGRVTVTIERSESEAILRVEDDGGGVPPESLGRIFERFHRGGKPERERERGVGLGLAIVKTIAQKHHGSVAAANNERGLAITIFLPNFHANLKKT
jgi:signal transduction histidine kinase